MLKPYFIARHSLVLQGENYTLDLMMTRFGEHEWFLKTVKPEEAWGGEVIAQGERCEVSPLIRALASGATEAEFNAFL